MTLTLDITPQVEAELARQATLDGRPLESYAAAILEEAARNRTAATGPNPSIQRQTRPGRSRLVEVCAMVAGLTDDLDFSRNPSVERPADF